MMRVRSLASVVVVLVGVAGATVLVGLMIVVGLAVTPTELVGVGVAEPVGPIVMSHAVKLVSSSKAKMQRMNARFNRKSSSCPQIIPFAQFLSRSFLGNYTVLSPRRQ